MCTNYAPVQRRILREIFGVEPPPGVYKAETYPDYAAPILRATDDGARSADLASFGMVPRQRIPPGARRYDTTNARSETVGERPAFARYWRQGQLCLVPATAFYEFAYPEDSVPAARRASRYVGASGCPASLPSASLACGAAGRTMRCPSPC